MTAAADDLTPPGCAECVSAKRVLVIAPHYDDETLGCGGLLIQLAAAGVEIEAIFLSDGSGGTEAVDDRDAYSRRRRGESRQAGAILGISRFHDLELADGLLAAHMPALVSGIRSALREARADTVLVPSPVEVSADHRAAYQALRLALVVESHRDDEEDWRPEQVLLYEVNRPQHPNLLVDVSAQLDQLRAAIGCYQSQLARHPYLQSALGLRRFRTLTLSPTIQAAEAYRRVRATDLRGPVEGGADKPQVTGTTGSVPCPLVSVVVRTKDRPGRLAEALESIAACRYPELEVVLVNDGGAVPTVRADYPLPVAHLHWSVGRGRSAAARAGVEAASGRYLAFLDDDDLFLPHHFETLVPAALRMEGAVVYSDALIGVYEIAPTGTWHRVEERISYQRDFDADALLIDNYIPLNTVLVERETLLQAGSFDPDLDLFEDWDMLIRLAERAPFERVPVVTCEYRHFRGAEQALGNDPRARPGYLEARASVLHKHRSKLTPQRLARAVDAHAADAAATRADRDALRGAVDRLRREPVRFILGRLRRRFGASGSRPPHRKPGSSS